MTLSIGRFFIFEINPSLFIRVARYELVWNHDGLCIYRGMETIIG
jgi:hypothetical protein